MRIDQLSYIVFRLLYTLRIYRLLSPAQHISLYKINARETKKNLEKKKKNVDLSLNVENRNKNKKNTSNRKQNGKETRL